MVADESAASGGRELSPDEAEQVAARLSEVAAAGASLAKGLRAAAQESASARVAAVLRHIADSVEQGQSLEETLAAPQSRLPRYVAGVIAAALKSGRLGIVLSQLVEHQRTRRERWRSVVSAMAYPLLLIAVALVVFILVELFVVREVVDALQEFQFVLPAVTQAMSWFSEAGVWVVPIGLLVLVVLAAMTRRIAGPARWRRILTTVPLFGPLIHWSGAADFAHSLACLIQQQMPLPEALRLTADGLPDANIAEASRRCAERVEQGRPLSEAMAETQRLPETLVPLVRWGERHGALGEALETAREMCERRVEMRAAMLRSMLPPLVFVLVGSVAWFMITGLLMPIFQFMVYFASFAPPLENSANLVNAPSLFGLILLGGALLWTVSLIYWRRGVPTDDVLKRIMTTAGWLLILTGLVGVFVYPLLTGAFWLALLTVLLLAGVAVVVLVSVEKYRTAEQRALIWVLAVAAERGISLAEAARSFASERSDEMGLRAARLADTLDAGTPLPLALLQSKNLLPKDSMLTADLGAELGILGPALRQAAESSQRADVTLRIVFDKLIYLFALACVMCGVIAFVAVWIAPEFEKIMDEFGLESPAASRLLYDVGNFLSRHIAVAWMLLMVLLFALLAAIGLYLGWIPRTLPLIGWLTRRVDTVMIMRILALAVRQERPVADTIRSLAERYPYTPYSGIWLRLQRASRAIDQGGVWQDCLRQAGLIGAADAAVLQAAERVGNLAWALNEMADSNTRRLAHRLTTVVNIAFPALVFGFGICVCIMAVGLIYPLVDILRALSF